MKKPGDVPRSSRPPELSSIRAAVWLTEGSLDFATFLPGSFGPSAGSGVSIGVTATRRRRGSGDLLRDLSPENHSSRPRAPA